MAGEIDLTINKILSDILKIDEPGKIGLQDDLAQYGLDSFNAVNLIIALEDTFLLKVDNNELGITSVRTKKMIVKLVEKYMDSKNP